MDVQIEHLASAAGLGVRTIQRIEATKAASYVRVLRAFEQWVTEPPAAAAQR